MVRVVFPVIKLSQGYLVDASRTLTMQRGVIIQIMHAFPPVHPVKVFHQSTSGEKQPKEPW